MPRVAICGLWHETNTFSSIPTGRSDFSVLEGEAITGGLRGTRTPIGGFLDGAGADLEILPAFFAGAMPSGIVNAETYEYLATRLVEQTARLRPDALLMDLHGAMVAQGCEDVETDLLLRLRRTLGRIPVGAVLDFHANTAPGFVRHVDLIAGYDTYPHTDPYERGMEVAGLLARLTAGDIRPVRAIVAPPLLIIPSAQATERSPMRDLMNRAHVAERQRGILNVTVAAGFPYGDVPFAGFSVVVTADGDKDLARHVAEDLASAAWEAREGFRVEQTPPDAAVAQALQDDRGPVILVDSADNVGGGAPGDGTVILDALLRGRARGAVVEVVDPDVVAAARRVGEGNILRADVGGKVDAKHGRPVPVSGTVVRIGPGDFTYRGSYMTGRHVDAGWAAVLDVDGVMVIVRERKVMPFDQEGLRVLGIIPERCRIIVVKSAIAWRAAYGSIASAVIDVDTPGVCTANLRALPFRRLRRPIVPLDDGVVWGSG
jgi:microcystin degradation protein MlrC